MNSINHSVRHAGRRDQDCVSTQEVVVLVVDDNSMIRNVIGRALKSLLPASRCHVCASGREALDALGSNECQVAFLDLSLPDMTGHELAREIRAKELAAKATPMPLVAISAFPSDQEWHDCKRNGFSVFLEKPFGRRELENCLSRILPAEREVPQLPF